MDPSLRETIPAGAVLIPHQVLRDEIYRAVSDVLQAELGRQWPVLRQDFRDELDASLEHWSTNLRELFHQQADGPIDSAEVAAIAAAASISM